MSAAWPDTFDADIDLISLHYDCSPDPDDFESMVADRAVLERRFGFDFLAHHVVAVIGTYGTNQDYKQLGCERVLNATWTSIGVGVRAHSAVRREAVSIVSRRYREALSIGGRVYVKEGGQSDFTLAVARALEAWQPGSARGIFVVQHSEWNEQTTSEGKLAALKSITGEYQRISDGNVELCRKDWAQAGPFVEAARVSWLGCAWQIAFDEFSHEGSWCHGWPPHHARPDTCLDFSDTAELFHILRISRPQMEAFYETYVAAPANNDAPMGSTLEPIDCSGRRPPMMPKPYIPPPPSAPPPSAPPPSAPRPSAPPPSAPSPSAPCPTRPPPLNPNPHSPRESSPPLPFASLPSPPPQSTSKRPNPLNLAGNSSFEEFELQVATAGILALAAILFACCYALSRPYHSRAHSQRQASINIHKSSTKRRHETDTMSLITEDASL